MGDPARPESTKSTPGNAFSSREGLFRRLICRSPIRRFLDSARRLTTGTGGAVLELQFGNQLQQSEKCCAFFRSQLFSEFIVSGYPRIDQALPVFVTSWRQRNVNCSARFCFSLRHKPVLNHGLDGPVDDSPVDAEKCGDLILIERGIAPECG